MEPIAHIVAHDIRNQYTIQYTPANNTMDGSFRQIKVTVNPPGHLTVRTRSGYYATPDQGKPVKGSNFPLILQTRIAPLAGFAALGVALLYSCKPLSKRGPQPDTGTVFHSDTRVVVCHTTVIDRAGHLVDHLTKDAFAVFENNVRQEIRVFKHEDVPVSIGLVIDSSGIRQQQ